MSGICAGCNISHKLEVTWSHACQQACDHQAPDDAACMRMLCSLQVCRNEKQYQQSNLQNDSAHDGTIMDTGKSELPLTTVV